MTKFPARVALSACLIFLLFLETSAQDRVNEFKPTVILISIDGMRADYPELHGPPTLNRLAAEGVRARWMLPSYPTKTFPNHYTVATGLYPDNHGLIENNMYDAERNKVFSLSDRSAVQDPAWWGGEPIWVTAAKAGQVAGAYFFPGTETMIQGIAPKYWKNYDGKVLNDQRVDTVLSWFSLPAAERPTIITMYFSDVDDAGHAHGPESAETRAAVLKVDANIERLANGLKSVGADRSTNLIIVSDHGMAPFKMRDAIVLDKMFDTDDAERIFWVGEFTQIFPKPGREETIYEAIKAKLSPNARIYRKGEFPSKFRFGKAKRIAPLVVVPEPGTIITNKERYARAEKEGSLDKQRGGHGYDNHHPLMRATFIAHGPAFKRALVADPFPNVDVYGLMCRILNLKPAPNDGKFSRVKGILR
jgi:predicted AlkP superfamily pyrophosphatase or phosphodiesterase